MSDKELESKQLDQLWEDDRDLRTNMIVSEFNEKLDRASGENRAQVKKQLQRDFDIEMAISLGKRNK